MILKEIAGQPSWKLSAAGISAWVTRLGGHLSPVAIKLGATNRMPLTLNPWSTEKTPKNLPAIVKVLRGDFFCMPFGLNQSQWKGVKYPVHGETANSVWSLKSAQRIENGFELKAVLRTKIRPATVRKLIRLVDNHPIVYCRHAIEGLDGLMNFGHHAMLQFPQGEATGLVAASKFAYGQVFPGEFEEAKGGGYTALKPGAKFSKLSRVADRFGGFADLSTYPAREGYDDLVMLVAPKGAKLGWSAVTFPKERYVWFGIKDPTVLRQTVLWHSNGGRHYAPWNGRHRGVLGLEEVTSNFHLGLKESVMSNSITRSGSPTVRQFRPNFHFNVNYAMGVARVPTGFDHVTDIRLANGEARIVSQSGKSVSVPFDRDFIYERH